MALGNEGVVTQAENCRSSASCGERNSEQLLSMLEQMLTEVCRLNFLNREQKVQDAPVEISIGSHLFILLTKFCQA